MKKLYFECYSGISGDMTVGALVDLGVNEENLIKALKSIPAKGFDVKISKVKKSGLDVCDFAVVLDKDHENYDHDMQYLHGNHDRQQHHHEHRNLKDIEKIIDETKINEHTKKIAKKIFKVLAKAEAKVHGVKIEDVHFHEVGVIDSIVDIIAIAYCIDELDINEVVTSSLYEGKGFIRCQHGLIPVPAPATLNIISEYCLDLHLLDIDGELVTPTGAAVIAALKTDDRLPSKYNILKVGMGAGKRSYPTSGILRVMIIEGGEENE